MAKRRIYLTRDVAKKLGITKTWLYQLEDKGRIPKARRDPISNYRYYTAQDIEKIKRIRKTKRG